MSAEPAGAPSRRRIALWFGLRVFWTVVIVAVYVLAIAGRAWWMLLLGLPALVGNIYIWRAVLTGRVKFRA